MKALPDTSDWEAVASFLAVENPKLLDRSVETQAKALKMQLGELQAMWRNADFRALVDQYTAVATFNPKVRRQQYEMLKEVSLYGEKDADKLKAFDIASRQARVKVPDRHEIDDRKTIEINVQHLPGDEGGFVPGSSFNPPQGRRARLGTKVSPQNVQERAGQIEGPFDSRTITVKNRRDSEDDEE